MKVHELLARYQKVEQFPVLTKLLTSEASSSIALKGLKGSSKALAIAAIANSFAKIHLVIATDYESAAYLYNDIENVFADELNSPENKYVHFYPAGYRKVFCESNFDNNNILLRAEVLNTVLVQKTNAIIVTYPEALSEKVVTKAYLNQNTLEILLNGDYSIDFITDLLNEYKYRMVDFVYEPGQFAIRGGIVDVFTFSNEKPYRIEFFGDTVASIRLFEADTQLSVAQTDKLLVFPNFQKEKSVSNKQSFLDYLPNDAIVYSQDLKHTIQTIAAERELALEKFAQLTKDEQHVNPEEWLIEKDLFTQQLKQFKIIEFGTSHFFKSSNTLDFSTQAQMSFNKNFEILIDQLRNNENKGVLSVICSRNEKQLQRLRSIIEDICSGKNQKIPEFELIQTAFHEGFMDTDAALALYTDHQIFERYHRYRLRDGFKSKEAITLREFDDLNPGDYITHIDYGVGRFAGLEKIEVNGKYQEAIKLVYKDHDILYVSIHSLHRISKYVGKENTEIKLHRLGSNAWENLKNKTKKKVKDIAKDLINLYAKRKAQNGFSFSPDTFMQNELEASFFFEDTPDQVKATIDVKADMEKDYPMDRLICGDVGFGKTEIAIRAAFKAVSDNKQVAILVPTTILALQHYRTFSERLKDFPCRVDYINRFKSTAKQKKTLDDLKSGAVDIVVGTHRLVGKDVVFKDLGLLIIDEEQKFGVAIKDKLKEFKVNVDTLTLTATPIPRTLQFSLMGARDLSIINTAPPNRYPIQTEIIQLDGDIIRKAIVYEIARGGQVFFVHNRVQNIGEIENYLKQIVPEANVGIAHGQMDGKDLEQIMYDFVEGNFDVLLTTTIIEAGLDIPNANTIIINDAHNFGLSDLHQLRGRVGRTNKKAFCYLISKPSTLLTQEARKRLQAIEDFADLGSGFNIAMRDLDIRGAGNLLGAEQSGFIADIGYDTYHKILDEAIEELKSTEFKDLFEDKVKEKPFVKDCQIETDLEILIPESYVSDIRERFSLYKELDNTENDGQLLNLSRNLEDRFGKLPQQTIELIDTIRLRWLAKDIGFEKIILKNGIFIGFFISNEQSAYFQSNRFTGIIEYVKRNPSVCKLKEKDNKLRLIINNVFSIQDVLKIFQKMGSAIAISEK